MFDVTAISLPCIICKKYSEPQRQPLLNRYIGDQEGGGGVLDKLATKGST